MKAPTADDDARWWLEQSLAGKLPCPRCKGGGEVCTRDERGQINGVRGCPDCRSLGVVPAK